MQTTFFVDDFFAGADDAGIEVELESRGRKVPVQVKRHITVEDRLSAELAAVRTEMRDGKFVIASVDQAAATLALVTKAIKSWPFVERDGTPLPITEANVSRFLGGVEPILQALDAAEKESAKALDPTATPSAGD